MRVALAAVALLGVSRLLPEHGFGLWLRLGAATLILLLPGRFVARAFGQRSAATALTCSCALTAGALAFTFAVHGSLDLTLALVLAAGAIALPFQKQSDALAWPRGRWIAALSGLVLGIAVWPIAGTVQGDALFHLGRVRKLVDFDSLSLRAVDEFADGGLHPGYAFPLWHAWLGLVAKVAGVDPTAVMVHESSLLAPLALVLALEMGRSVFRSFWLALATMLAQVAMIAFAPGGGGAYTSLDLPGTASRQLLVPATIALFFRYVREPRWALGLTLAFSGMNLAFVHPTYAMFVAIPFGGYALVRVARDPRVNALALAWLCAPILLVFAWLSPIVSDTRSHNPDAAERLRAVRQYAGDLVVHSTTDYHLGPWVVSRAGAVAVAALLLAPLAAFAFQRRWAAYVLGGTALILAIELWPLAFTHFSDLVSMSQSRRAAGFVPFAFAFTGGLAVLARATRWFVLPIALAGGIVLQLAYPGDFGTKMAHGGPAWVTWFSLWGCLAGIVVGAVLLRRGKGRYDSRGPLVTAAASLFLLPVAVHGLIHWVPKKTIDRSALTPGLVRFLSDHVPERSVVYADLETSYRISAYLPVYVANGPPAHVANTKQNLPYARRDALIQFLRTRNPAIPRRYGAQWLVLRDGERVRGARLVYRDGRFRVYRL
jgi:hypothetical protein